ncbi:hypothetical protein M2272_003057 [Mycobacterium frederiksbergense]|uniref:WXG100 family type VII secretion target n=1 Tax=Mycolicibacterium frederiksbergense TaxID=117567 RepID=A0ABT6L0E4_9MYCO|nr:type VII secretion target [Mycolicibacterium frederiksbergense]MDH6196414.1 hypothetical protein [Mycolicibacterium frederiksbergense]
MPASVNVDTARLREESDRTFVHMAESRVAHSGHDDELMEAAGQWPGDIGSAIAFVADMWSDQREDLHRHVGRIGMGMQEAAVSYDATDSNAAEAIDSVSRDLPSIAQAVDPRDM